MGMFLLCFAWQHHFSSLRVLQPPCFPCSLCVCLSAGVLSVCQLEYVCFQEVEWVDGMKECSCSCHEGSSDLKLKKSKKRSCNHCSSKVSGEAWSAQGEVESPFCDDPGASCLPNNGVRKEINPKVPSGASLSGALTAPARPSPTSLLLTFYCPSLLC